MSNSEINLIADAVAQKIAGRDLITEAQAMERLGVSSKGTMAKLRAQGLNSYQLDTMRGRYYLWPEIVDFITTHGAPV